MAFEITVPRLGWSMEEGTFLGWLKQEGEYVAVGESLFTLESEKASQEVEAVDSGILRIAPDAPAAGTVILVGALLGYLVEEGETALFQAPSAAQIEPPEPAALPVVDNARVLPAVPALENAFRISPRAARTALALGIDLRKLRGTGRTKRIRERDVLAAAASTDRPDPVTPAPVEPAHSNLPGHTKPMSATRRTIARRMSAGIQQAAPVTLNSRADATQLVLIREKLKAAAWPGEPVPSFNDMLVKLAAAALQEHPLLTAQWREETLFFPDHINIAIAVDVDAGLLAPVIQNVPSLNLTEVAEASRALIAAARANRLSGELLQGGTFTITNLGSLGIEAFTPIINLPQCAILGVGRIAFEAVVVAGQIVPRQMVTLSLTFDHRIVDGAPAGRFLETLRHHIESPAYLLES